MPTLLYARHVRADGIPTFGERACAHGSLGVLPAKHILPIALANAGRFLRDGGAQAVKVEGGVRSARVIEALVRVSLLAADHAAQQEQLLAQFNQVVLLSLEEVQNEKRHVLATLA